MRVNHLKDYEEAELDPKIYGIEIPEGAVLKEQERAYTSPIWYTPGED